MWRERSVIILIENTCRRITYPGVFSSLVYNTKREKEKRRKNILCFSERERKEEEDERKELVRQLRNLPKTLLSIRFYL